QYELQQGRLVSHLFDMIVQWRDDAALGRHQTPEHVLRFGGGNEALLQNVKIDQLYRLA
ncbi:antibiotic biosynthesis monooxygenase, partial [Acinetobacter baumannii]